MFFRDEISTEEKIQVIIHDSDHWCLFLAVPLLLVRTSDFELKTANTKFNGTTCTASTTIAIIHCRIIIDDQWYLTP